jgi:hypothetical protein
MTRRFLVAFLLPIALAQSISAADANKREPVAVLKSESGTMLARESPGKDWKPILEKQDISSEDSILGLNDAFLVSKNRAVEVRTITDLSNRSPFPIIETVIRLNANTNADLDFWLERGRVDVTNVKPNGSAKVVVRFRERVWTMVLDKPGTRFAIETYGRWPEGTRFTDKPKPDDAPVQSVLLVVLKGEVQRSCSRCSVAMTAPPGPAEFGWDSVNGDDNGAKRLDALPDWVKKLDPDSEEGKRRWVMREKFRQVLLKDGFGEALLFLLEAKEPEVRRIGVYALGAFDQLRSLADLLGRSKDMEAWNNAVIALRHWIGRAPGQDQALYKQLLNRGLSPLQAKKIMQMLMGFSPEERASPQLYKVLIEALKDERLGIRGMAYWHLQRLAPRLKIAYNPIGDKAEWEKAYDDYKKALAAGELPPKN